MSPLSMLRRGPSSIGHVKSAVLREKVDSDNVPGVGNMRVNRAAAEVHG